MCNFWHFYCLKMLQMFFKEWRVYNFTSFFIVFFTIKIVFKRKCYIIRTLVCVKICVVASQQLLRTDTDFYKCYTVISIIKLFFNAVPLQSGRPVNICFSLCPLCTVISMDSVNLLMILCTVWWLNPQIPQCGTLFLSCWTIYTNRLSQSAGSPVHTYRMSPHTHSPLRGLAFLGDSFYSYPITY